MQATKVKKETEPIQESGGTLESVVSQPEPKTEVGAERLPKIGDTVWFWMGKVNMERTYYTDPDTGKTLPKIETGNEEFIPYPMTVISIEKNGTLTGNVHRFNRVDGRRAIPYSSVPVGHTWSWPK